jgi:hypothetical protein
LNSVGTGKTRRLLEMAGCILHYEMDMSLLGARDTVSQFKETCLRTKVTITSWTCDASA